MDIGLVIDEIVKQFAEVQSPFGLAKAIALVLTLLLAVARGFRARRAQVDGLMGWDAIVVGMLTNLLSFNLMMPVFGAVGGVIQSSMGIDLAAPTITSRAASITVLMVMLVGIASLSLGIVMLLRGLGRASRRPGTGSGQGAETEADRAAAEG